MPELRDIRGDIPLTVAVPATPAGVAAGGSVVAPFDLVLTGAVWVPGAAITADGTDYFTVSFRNRGAAGAGTVQFATARAYSAGDGALSTPEQLTLSGTAADLEVDEGDVLAAEVVHSGSGLICPGGVVQLTTRRR